LLWKEIEIIKTHRSTPPSVQNQGIPEALTGSDVICQAKSGMGKTAVFVISVLEQLQNRLEKNESDPGLVALVLCHTRELAFQICREFERFKKHMEGVNVEVFYGGMPIAANHETLKKQIPHIVIGTPGRILALAQDKSLPLNNIKHFILDECDRMIESLGECSQPLMNSLRSWF